MSREHLSKRKNWQMATSVGSSGREETVKKIMFAYLTGKNGYVVHEKPKQLSEIYNERWGIEPDFAIENSSNGKIVFFEVKRQGPSGNAHERACKYFAPGIQEIASKIAGVGNPFFFVFMDGLVSDKKKNCEITKWFDAEGYRDRLLLWDRKTESLIDYFNNIVSKYLL